MVDLGIADRFFLNPLNEALENADPHSELFNAECCQQAGQKVDVDFDILNPFIEFLMALGQALDQGFHGGQLGVDVQQVLALRGKFANGFLFQLLFFLQFAPKL